MGIWEQFTDLSSGVSFSSWTSELLLKSGTKVCFQEDLARCCPHIWGGLEYDGTLGMAPSFEHPMPNTEATMVSPSLYDDEVASGASCAASPACPPALRDSQQGLMTQPQATR